MGPSLKKPLVIIQLTKTFAAILMYKNLFSDQIKKLRLKSLVCCRIQLPHRTRQYYGINIDDEPGPNTIL